MEKVFYTTGKDLSVEYFNGWEIKQYKNYEPCSSEVVYFRDPFNDGEFSPDAKKIDELISGFSGVRSVDNIRSFGDIYLLVNAIIAQRQNGDK